MHKLCAFFFNNYVHWLYVLKNIFIIMTFFILIKSVEILKVFFCLFRQKTLNTTLYLTAWCGTASLPP